MLKQKEISDRFEIQDLLVKYCDAIDTQNWDVLDTIFTDDAIIDYTEVGGACGSLPEIKAYLAKALTPFSAMQHMLGLPMISIKGDEASARTALFNPMVLDRDGEPTVFFVGLWYQDKLIRTPAGWRIQSRRENVSYLHNLPEDFIPVSD